MFFLKNILCNITFQDNFSIKKCYDNRYYKTIDIKITNITIEIPSDLQNEYFTIRFYFLPSPH